MKVLLVVNRYLNKRASILQLAERINNCGVQVALDDTEYWEQDYAGLDGIVVPGGDGSMVQAARRHLRSNLPIWGVNMGTVGFLSQLQLEDVESGMTAFKAGNYTVEERMMLQVQIAGVDQVGGFYALNEMCLRSAEGKVLNIDLTMGTASGGSYRGDGLIVATPTGSTAYSLSCGGSILEPELELFGITPIASYLLAQRPVVLSAQRSLTLAVSSSSSAYVLLDGQIRIDVVPGQDIHIAKAPWKLKLAHLKDSNFFAAVVDKRLKRSQ